MYRIKTLVIDGLHNVDHMKIDLKNFCYFFGKNGAGKTTILNAIQLALLGYIPGSAKTNIAIMRHAGKPEMYVAVTLDDNGQEVTVRRSWTTKGASVSASTNITPADTELDAILGNLSLPVFDFNEFMNQSANVLKNWFISILPPDTADLHIGDELDRIADKYGTTSLSDELREIRERIVFCDGPDELTKIQNGAAIVKDAMLAKKTQITNLQNTINTLVLYDDTDGSSSTAVQAMLRAKKTERDKYAAASTKIKNIELLETKIAAYNHLPAETQAEDTELRELSTKNLANESKLDSVLAEIRKYTKEADEANGKISMLSELANSGNICPFTKQACDTAASAIEDAQQQINKLTESRTTIQSRIGELRAESNTLEAEIRTFLDIFRRKRMDYEARESLREELATAKQCITVEEYELIQNHESVDEFNAEIEALETKYAHTTANEKFDALSDKLNADKAAATLDLEVLKAWDKLLGANGLQTKLMSGPFTKLADKISAYLEKFFDAEGVKAEFTLVEKANSFNFGMKYPNSNYVAFETLSSGEQCLYTLSLLLALTETAETNLPIILIDDLLDHLDARKASATFLTLHDIDGIQILMAGVQPCDHPAAKDFVEVLGNGTN